MSDDQHPWLPAGKEQTPGDIIDGWTLEAGGRATRHLRLRIDCMIELDREVDDIPRTMDPCRSEVIDAAVRELLVAEETVTVLKGAKLSLGLAWPRPALALVKP